jgi:hypothetical protein
VKPADLTEPEQLLWKSFSGGELVDLGPGAAGSPVIRSEVIAALLLGGAGAQPGGTAGIRLRGATVTGCLDLTAGSVAWPLVCDGCQFDTEIRFVDSTLRTVCILNSGLPALDGTRLRLNGILDMTGSQVAGTVQLQQARVDGQVRLHRIRAGAAGAGAVAVLARGLSVDGEADCAGMEAHGLVSFEGAAVTGTLNLADSKISCPGGRGLDLNYATIGGTLACPGLAVDGETRANNCRISVELVMRGARLDNPGGIAFSAGGLDVAGGAFISSGFSARGEFTLIGARMAANLSVRESTFDNPGGTAVNLERASIGMLNAQGVSCRGQMIMAGADVSGDANLVGAVLETGDGKPALNAERSRIGSTLVLSGVRALGEVNLRSIRVGERLLLGGAELRDPFGMACRLSRAQVTADLFCDHMTVDGELKLTGATIGATVALHRSVLSHPAGLAISAGGLRAQEFLLEPDVRVEGGVDFRHATIGVLHDNPAAWPDRLYLDGLTYQALIPRLPAGQRLGWLARDPGGHQPQPYEQLAAHYTAIGQPAQARHVLYAKERIQHQGKGPVSRAWSLLQDITVGYGYRPRRALGWLALLLTAGSVVFSVAPPPVLQPGNAPHFNGIIYTLDLMLPVVNLGQKYAFNPGGAEQWLSYFLIAAGWTLATTVATGVARVLRRG